MRILFAGNVCNFAYWYAKWGRMLGYDTHALIEQDNLVPRDRPDWEDPAYDPDDPPPWVSFYRVGTPRERALRGVADEHLGRLLERFDAVHTFSPAAAIAVDSIGIDFVHHTVGSFARTAEWWRGVTPRVAVSPRRAPTVLRFRAAMRRASRIVVSTAIDHAEVAASPFAVKLVAIPIAYDVEKAGAHAQGRLDLREAPQRLRFVLPARQHWELKGQDIVLRGVAELSPRERDRLDVVALDWGPDRERSRALCAELGLDSTVRFVPMLQKQQLWEEFGRPEVVVIDQVPNLDFAGGALGGVARDALAVGAPVITHASPRAQLRIHRSAPPVLHTERNAQGVRDRVRECLELTGDELRRLAAAGRNWVHAECHYTRVLPAYIELHKTLSAPRAAGMGVP